LPVRDDSGAVIAVFDIDSDQPDAFTEVDSSELTKILQNVFSA
jgi:GAF domain-containing protein